MILLTKWFGTFLCDGNRVVEHRLFPKDVEAIAERMRRMRGREVLEEELELAERASAVAERRLGGLGKKIIPFDSSFLRAENYGFEPDLLRQASMMLARESLTEEDPGAYITEQVRAYDDLVATCNLLSERLREWYGLYFPELERMVDDRKYSQLVAEDPARESVLKSLDAELEESTGATMDDEDLAAIQRLARCLDEIFRAREAIDTSMTRKMKEEAPNLTAVAGPIIGARLISLAGGLKRLAGMPTSTVQLLGAERAMFRHLKDGSRPPKHGVIFQHPHIHRAPYWQRGKIARALAGKISLAAKADFYGEADISAELLERLERRIEEIGKRYPSPPKRRVKKRGKGRAKGAGRR